MLDIIGRLPFTRTGLSGLLVYNQDSTLAKISARSRRDLGYLAEIGEISVILGENFSGQKISARSRRDRVNLAEVSEISPR